MSRNEQIRRELGFGQGTLQGKLREYYDPFERREPEPERASAEIDYDASIPYCYAVPDRLPGEQHD